MCFDKLKCVLELHQEEAHDKHNDTGGRTRHSHRTVHQTLRPEVWVVFIDLSEQFLDSDIFTLLHTSFDLGPASFKVDFEDLVRDWEYSLAVFVSCIRVFIGVSCCRTLSNVSIWRIHV